MSTEIYGLSALPLLAAITAAATTTAGILLVRAYGDWAERNAGYFMCFAAGVLIAVSFLHIAPRSFAMTEYAPYFMFGGYFLMHAFNRFITAHVCDKPARADFAIGLVPLVGIGLHSLLDGVIYSISFAVGTTTGLLVAVGMVLHELPEGIVTYALLARSGFTGRTAFLLAFVAAALTTPLGALISLPLVERLSDAVLGPMLAASTGTLIYVGATHLLPRAEREGRQYSAVALVAGIAVAFGIAVIHR